MTQTLCYRGTVLAGFLAGHKLWHGTGLSRAAKAVYIYRSAAVLGGGKGVGPKTVS